MGGMLKWADIATKLTQYSLIGEKIICAKFRGDIWSFRGTFHTKLSFSCKIGKNQILSDFDAKRVNFYVFGDAELEPGIKEAISSRLEALPVQIFHFHVKF